MPAISADAADTLRLVRQLQLLDENSIRLLEQLFTNCLNNELADSLLNGKEDVIAVTLFRVCVNAHTPHVLGYTLRFLADLVCVHHELAIQFGKSELLPRFQNNPAELFLTFATQHDEPGITNPALYLAANAMRYGSYGDNASPLKRFFHYIHTVCSAELLRVEDVEFAVQACVQLARRKELRHLFFSNGIIPCIPHLLTNIVSTDSAGIVQVIYHTLMLIWLLSFEYVGIVLLVKEKIIPHLHRVLQRVQKEKCVRVALMTLINMAVAENAYKKHLQNATSAEWVDENIEALAQLATANNGLRNHKGPPLISEMVSVGMQKTLGQLCRRKFGDEDISGLLEKLYSMLEDSMNVLTSFSEYRGEVLSGELEWTPVHTSAKFWRENATQFDNQNYEVLKALGRLILDTHDTTTLAIACHDLGEVVRYHPSGRQLLTLPDMKPAKERVLTLMSHENATVAKEALLCTQKMMVQRLEYIQDQI